LTFLVLITVELGPVVYIKLYTSIGGQRAETFENPWPRQIKMAMKSKFGMVSEMFN